MLQIIITLAIYIALVIPVGKLHVSYSHKPKDICRSGI